MAEALSEEQRQAIWDELDGGDEEQEGQTKLTERQTIAEIGEKPDQAQPPKAQVREEPKSELQQILDSLNSLKGSVTKLESDTRATAGRVGALQGEIAKAGQRAATTSTDAPTDRQIAALAKSPDKWNALKGDFPEWAEATEELLKANLSGPPNTGNPEDLQAVKQSVDGLLGEVTNLKIALVDAKHPGWIDVVKTDEFKSWREAQPLEVLALGKSDAPNDAVKMLDMFDAWKTAQANPAQIEAQRQNRLNQSVTVRGTASTRTMKSLDDMTDEEIWNLPDDDPRLRKRA